MKEKLLLKAINSLNLLRNAPNLLWRYIKHVLQTLDILNCSVQWKCAFKTWILSCHYSNFTIGLQKYCIKMIFWIHVCIELNNLGLFKSVICVNGSSEWVRSIFGKFRQFTALKVQFFLHFANDFTYGKVLIGQFLKRPWSNFLVFNGF